MTNNDLAELLTVVLVGIACPLALPFLINEDGKILEVKNDEKDK